MKVYLGGCVGNGCHRRCRRFESGDALGDLSSAELQDFNDSLAS